jgi:GNAT superfamily N-acetyltransferase
MDVDEHPVWPAKEGQPTVLYVRRVIVSRRYARLGLGAALLDWAANVAKTDHRAELIRIDVRTTNLKLHAYYEGQRFTRCPDPQGLGDYPSQALFERGVHVPEADFTKLFTTEDSHDAQVTSLSRRLP